ncbi:MAG: DUF819 family protein [Gemmatimonadota bacterium]|nr:DUF819 family protein [Gemmatimonadota bacterium]MDH5804683.1 DUF819 family protein [Gemmatimonadota bacterium]
MVNNPWLVLVVLLIVVVVAIEVQSKTKVTRALGSVLIAILLATALANLGILPPSSSTYDALDGVVVNLAITFVLLGVDFRGVLKAGRAMLGAFGLGVLGTAIGATVGALIVHEWLGAETWKLAGQYTGTYTGGSVNFVAVGQSLGTSPELYTAAIAADNVTTTLWVAVCLSAPLLFARWWPAVSPNAYNAHGSDEKLTHGLDETSRPITLRDTAVIGALGMGLTWMAGWLGGVIPGVPSVLWLTTMALLVAQTPVVRRLEGAALWGNYLMHLFLATIGARSVIAEIIKVGPVVFYFTVVVVAVHGLVVFGVGRFWKLDLQVLSIASQANVGGPASAIALATAKGYSKLVVPAAAVGLLGYAVGNYTGLSVARIVRGILGA